MSFSFVTTTAYIWPSPVDAPCGCDVMVGCPSVCLSHRPALCTGACGCLAGQLLPNAADVDGVRTKSPQSTSCQCNRFGTCRPRSCAAYCYSRRPWRGVMWPIATHSVVLWGPGPSPNYREPTVAYCYTRRSWRGLAAYCCTRRARVRT